MSGRNASVLLIFALSALAFFIAPDVNAISAADPPADTLAAALSAAHPPDTGVAISVAAENVYLPQGAKPLAPRLPIGTIADTYGRLVRSFGSVQAVAPRTMTILNTHPATPNLYQDMAPPDVLRLLALSLNPGQWSDLTGAQGLGIDDLDDKQRLMFEALFPGGALTIMDPSSHGPDHVQSISADRVMQSRLRLSQSVQMMLPVVGAGPDHYMGPSMPPKPGDPKEYVAVSSGPRGIGGISTKGELPNVPKRSNLDYEAPLFRSAVSLKDLKTVGDLVARISHQTHTELYADARLENLPLTIVGEDHAAPADLLPALAFCVTGTFREVGPAFVLTDDLVGLGTQRVILEAFNDSVNEQRNQLVGPSDALLRAHPLADVPLSDNSLTLTPEELKLAATDTQKSSNAGVTIHLPFAQLTPEQQSAAQALLDEWNAEQQAGEKGGAFAAHPEQAQQLSLDGKIMLFTMPSLQLRVPSLNGVVNMEQEMAVYNLFQAQGTVSYLPAPGVPTPTPPASDILLRYARRAVMVQPRTLQDLDQMLAAMPAANLNEIWLIVPGPGDPGSAGKSASSMPDAGALVDEALKKAGPAHIRVLPVLSLFKWGAAAPATDIDYTIRGETSAQRSKREAMEFEQSHHGVVGPIFDPRELVSPFAPSVETDLDALLKAVIRPGITGMVWHDTTVPGYEPLEHWSSDGLVEHARFPREDEPDFGYTLEGRLRFLREKHTDPIDIGPPRYANIDLSLPFFNDEERTMTLSGEWDQLRASVDLAVVQRLDANAQRMAAANSPASFTGVPVLIPNEQSEYISWDDQRRLPFTPMYPERGTPEDIAARVRKSSRVVFGEFEPWAIKYPERLVSQLLHSAGAREWDGVIFDLTPTTARPTAPAQSSLDLLTKLAASLHVKSGTAQ